MGIRPHRSLSLKASRTHETRVVPPPPPRKKRKRRGPTAITFTTPGRYRAAPDTFAEAPNGMVYVYNGIDPVKRWDGVTGATELAGIVAPKTTPQIGGSGNGPIVGEFYCYVRFLDRYGNVSSLSPISGKLTALREAATITDVSNTAPIVVTTEVAHGRSAGETVKITEVSGNDNANGFWTVTPLTATTFSLDNSFPNSAYVSGGRVWTGVMQVNYSSIEIPTDSKVVRRQIVRNRDGDVATFYVDIDTTDITSTQFVSLNRSQDLAGAAEVAITDPTGQDLALHFNDPPPNYFSACVMQGGRMFAAVTRDYDEGCASVVSGSPYVTGIGAVWNKTTFVGRFFTVVGDTARYEIVDVIWISGSNPQLTLKTAFAGTTDPLARYVISPTTEVQRQLAWSAPGKPESFPNQNSRQLPADQGLGSLTGLLSQGSWVYVLFEQGIQRFGWYQNPNTDGAFSQGANRGCVNHKCCIPAGGVSFMLDHQGAHAFAGNDDEPISDAIADLFTSFPDTAYRINWRAGKFFHGVYDPNDGLVRWFVCLAGDYTPRHALVCDYRRKRWAIEAFAFPIGASCLGYLDGRPQVYVGTTAKRMLAINTGNLDLADPQLGTVRGTATSAGPGWIADTSATFPQAWVGKPLITVEGLGRGQTRTIHTVSGTKLYVTPAFSVRPDSTTVYQVGGIPWKYRSGWINTGASPQGINREIELLYDRLDAAAGFSLRLFDDTDDDAQVSSETRNKTQGDGVGSTADSAYLDVDATRANGFARVGLAGIRAREDTGVPRYTSLELAGVTNLDRQNVWGVNINGALPQ